MIKSCPIWPHHRILSSRLKSILAGNALDSPAPASTRWVERMRTARGSHPSGPVVGIAHSFSMSVQPFKQFDTCCGRCAKFKVRTGGQSAWGLWKGDSMRRRPAREKETGAVDLESSLAITAESKPPRDHPARNQYLFG